MEIHKLPGAAMMPLVLLMPLGLHSDAPGSTHIVFAHTVNKPVKPAQLCEVLVRALLSPKAAARQQPTSKPGETLTERLPLSILLCDDNAINQKVAARILQTIGYQPDLAANGREALDALDKKPYNLIFMDVMMPEMDGLEATCAIRERQRNGAAHPNYQSRIVIVAMTAQAMQGDREKCLAAGMDDYLSKPILPKDVRAIVERWGPQATPATPSAPTATADAATPAPTARADAPTPVPKPAPTADVPPAAPAPKVKVPAPKPAPAPKAAVPEPVPVPTIKADTPITLPVPKAEVPAGEEPPVEMDVLNDLTDGDTDSLRELVDLFFKQTSQQLEQLGAAVHANKPEDVRRLAHSCAGASATLGMIRFVPLLRKLERQGASGMLTSATQIYEDTTREFELIQQYLAAQLNSAAPPQPAVHI
jgi:CheY-like chemotaxis protein